jgi:DNA polymerase V
MGSNIRSGKLEFIEPASWPSPAQDYYEGGLSLDRELIPRPASTFVVRMASDHLRSLGIFAGDELLVDRSLDPVPGRVVVVLIDGEHRVGTLQAHGPQLTLATDAGELTIDATASLWGVATTAIHHLIPRRLIP